MKLGAGSRSGTHGSGELGKALSLQDPESQFQEMCLYAVIRAKGVHWKG